MLLGQPLLRPRTCQIDVADRGPEKSRCPSVHRTVLLPDFRAELFHARQHLTLSAEFVQRNTTLVAVEMAMHKTGNNTPTLYQIDQ